MDNLALNSSSQKPVLGFTANPRTDAIISNKPLFCSFKIPKRSGVIFNSKSSNSNSISTPRAISKSNEADSMGKDCFARISSSSDQHTSSVGATPQIAVPPPYSQVGSPLFWVGVGVAFSAAFSWTASYLKKYAMQQAFKTMMGQMDAQNNQSANAGFSPGSPFPFPPPASPGSPPGSPFPFPTPTSQSSAATSAPASQRTLTVDVPPTKIEATPTPTEAISAPTEAKDNFESPQEPKKSAFVDVSPEETLKTSFEKLEESTETESQKDSEFANQSSENGSAFKPTDSPSVEASSTGTKSNGMSVEALEKMMDDPTVQKMVYPYLPEEMRNPTSFKWMLQNPQYRQQLQDMLNNMGGSPEWDNRMMDSLKNFDLNSPEVKEQFDQIGLTPEEVISKIMANPEVAMAFQNPRVQAAIMDCSQNPMSIIKYQNDKEVMDVFNKISELFPGVTGAP
ncbi:putative Heat shock chaperonin-binding, STI1 domain-containing protein [Helianthus annuus]|uniref:Protein TIC 40, chloroplastic n=1 Tax=Helianthus annuus TaxID=4232 RepID=A0A251VDF3_HELAN|nr:protein TIC 40, chloroplastic isoform X1 [Helianthus annuus]KAF5817412.1 putative Heat shock chaperonin-binding protein [Helianthus annuus]KAJ0938814.1 putative Heat shock chaperonin-binding, STI1 domain-containing protein [Helianthus annuus]KAJ0950757.1 putative Heat shock chaperonin-binding, STI1 domain-containing protein [Helianthus annuus]